MRAFRVYISPWSIIAKTMLEITLYQVAKPPKHHLIESQFTKKIIVNWYLRGFEKTGEKEEKWKGTCPITFVPGGTEHQKLFWSSKSTTKKSICGAWAVSLQKSWLRFTNQIICPETQHSYSRACPATRFHPLEIPPKILLKRKIILIIRISSV